MYKPSIDFTKLNLARNSVRFASLIQMDFFSHVQRILAIYYKLFEDSKFVRLFQAVLLSLSTIEVFDVFFI